MFLIRHLPPSTLKYFSDRSDQQCQHRWHKVLNPEIVKGPWTKEEDEKGWFHDLADDGK
jgi:hypothetical protein